MTEWFTTAVLALMAYTYAIYPLVLVLLHARRTSSPLERGSKRLPPATLIILARNEAGNIEKKLRDVAALDYPQLSVLVVSDGSDDETAALARQHGSAPEVLELSEAKGKTAATLKALSLLRTELVFFTDVPGVLAPDALRRLGEAMVKDGVGCAGGRVLYGEPTDELGKGFSVYQSIARSLRDAEGAYGSATVISGAVHGAWRSSIPMAPEGLSLELAIPLECVRQGKSAVYVSQAICVEEGRSSWGAEWRARVRMGIRSWCFMAYLLPRIPAILGSSYTFHFLSHKGLRWLGGPLVASMLLGWGVDVLLSILVPFFLVLALYQFRSNKRLISVVLFFCLVNAAYVVSLVLFLAGRRAPAWQPERRP